MTEIKAFKIYSSINVFFYFFAKWFVIVRHLTTELVRKQNNIPV